MKLRLWSPAVALGGHFCTSRLDRTPANSRIKKLFAEPPDPRRRLISRTLDDMEYGQCGRNRSSGQGSEHRSTGPYDKPSFTWMYKAHGRQPAGRRMCVNQLEELSRNTSVDLYWPWRDIYRLLHTHRALFRFGLEWRAMSSIRGVRRALQGAPWSYVFFGPSRTRPFSTGFYHAIGGSIQISGSEEGSIRCCSAEY